MNDFTNPFSDETGITFNPGKYRTSASFWIATWIDNAGIEHSKAYPVRKWGHEQAKRMAIAYRQNRLAELSRSE